MQRPAWQRVADIGGWSIVPSLAGVYLVAVIAVALRPGLGITSYPELSSILTILDVIAGAGLMGAGLFAWSLRRRSVGILALAAGACWLAADWAGAVGLSPGSRSLAEVATLMTLPLVIHLVLRIARSDSTPSARRTLILLYMVMGGLGLAWMATYVPWNDPDCLSLCDTPGGPFGERSTARVFAAAWQVLTTAGGIGLTAWAVVAYARSSRVARRRSLPTLLPAAFAGLAWAFWGIALLFPSRAVSPTGEILVAAFAWRAVALAVVAVGLGRRLVVGRRTLSAVRRITEQLSPLPGGDSLRTALASALGDPGLQLVFPLPGGGGSVDAAGVAVAGSPIRVGAHLTPIVYGGATVAIAVASADAPDIPVADDLGEAVRLAAANEALLAAVRHEVIELQASRRRIVEAGHAARHAIERDLHDGAQHRMLGVLHELGLARAAAADAGEPVVARRLTDIIEDVDAAIESLRRLARGIHHATLTEAGLGAALEALADESPIPLDVDAPGERRYPPEVEATAWRVVSDSIKIGDALGAVGVTVLVRSPGEHVDLDVTIDGTVAWPDTTGLADRVGAVGGSLRVERMEPSTVHVHVELPCE